MERKYGKKKDLKLDPLSYSLYLMGEGGIGKTTIIYQLCEKLVGPDGYMFFTCGYESDNNTIQGIVSENVWDWEHFEEVVDYIIEHRFDEYADLKVVAIDTIDELLRLAESEAIRIWNREHPDKRTNEFKATYGGFNGPTDKVIELIVDKLWALKRVGVQFIIIGHVKRVDNVDPVTQENYSVLGSSIDKRYFSAMKEKVDILGVAYVNREIVRVKTGRKNVVTGQEEVKGTVKDMSRVICFRDDAFSIDSKSRFADIVDEIPMDADSLIQAITDAIKAEYTRGGKSLTSGYKEQAEAAKAEEQVQAERAKQYLEKQAAESEEGERESVVSEIARLYPEAVSAKKTEAKNLLKATGAQKFTDPDVPVSVLKEIVASLTNQ